MDYNCIWFEIAHQCVSVIIWRAKLHMEASVLSRAVTLFWTGVSRTLLLLKLLVLTWNVRRATELKYRHVLPDNVTNNWRNACLTLGFIWPFLGRATTIHFTNPLHINKNLVCSSRCNFWTILSAGLSPLLDRNWTPLNSVVKWTGAACSFSFVTSRRTEYRSPSPIRCHGNVLSEPYV
jgi:hypothetical protein